MSQTPLETVDDVLDALGGSSAVMAITGVRTPQAISNWRRRRHIPPQHFSVMADALIARGHVARRRLWGMTPPDALSA
jgi:hypothetical protein